MSRIVSRSEQEPLMRLQRPSSASSQDTAHLVNACLRHFLDNSSTPVPLLDRARVDNLRVSSAEQRDGYHKRYVELLNTVYDEHHRRISEVDQVEKHLIMAKAASLAAEEKALSTLDQQLGLPKGPCQFPQHLDEALLQHHHLLVPSSYLITSRPPVAAPQPPSTPSYLKPTFTSDQHSRVTYEEYSTTRKTTSPKKASVSSLTQSTTRKASHKSQTMSSGFCTTMKVTEEVAEKTMDEAGGFVPNPSRVIFTDYVRGQTYTASLQLTNSSGTSRKISVTQPSTGYFSVRVDTFPSSEGSLAPGISCTYLVSFSPDSIGTFDDCVKVVSHEGVCLTVPLLGRRPQPLLEVSSLPVWYSHPSVSSDNTITCCNIGAGSGSYTIEHKGADESHDGHFTLSATQFDLDPRDEMSVKVVFHSNSTGEFTYPIAISCNNGDVMELTLIGCCEEAHVGVAGVRPVTSQHEVEQWSGAPPTTISDVDYLSSNDEQVIFDSVNPYQSGYQVVNIRNYCHMELPYHWSLYRPIIGPTSQPVPSLHSPHSITPHSGTLAADCTTGFLITFTPLQPGHFTDDVHFILDGHEATQVTPSVQLHLAGTCDEYDVILSPSCMVIPGGIECGIDHCYRIKMINNSLSSVYYQWQEVCVENVHIRMEPSEGHIVPDGVGHCELVVRPLLAGHIMVDLHCIILHHSQPLVMCVRATSQAQTLILDLPSLNYGLIANGSAKTLQLPVRNDAEIPIKFQLHEIVPPSQQGCLVCIPSDGEVPAHGSIVCSVKCDTSHEPMGEVQTHSSIRTTLLCITDLGAESCVQVLAEVQSPKVCLKSCDLHVDDAYVNIPTDHVISLHNMTMVPARFNWKEQLFGDGADHCCVHITPSHGLLSPRSSCDLTVTIVWTTEGENLPPTILCCKVDGMKEPILFNITGHVHGLSIHYCVVDGPDDQGCQLNFGCVNPLGVAPHSLYLKVTNDTAIPTNLVAAVTYFPSGLTKVDQSVEGDHNMLLNLTANLADPRSMSDKTSQSVLASQLLSKGRGCCFVVTPSELDIPAYSCHMIQVTAYSDMWGVYTDQLVCQVQGLPPVSIPINYGVVGCPILFPTTATFGATTVRFGSHPTDSGLVRRTIRLKNTSPCEITMDWEVYNITPDDKQLIDLTVIVGRPFPSIQSYENNDDDIIDDDVMNESRDLVKVMIKAHEGVVSSYPITIKPYQTVIKGYSSASVEVAFNPTVMKTKDGCISSYILGHMSLTSEHDYYSGAVRAEGYDIDPIRINMTGKSLYPRLSIQCDNDDGRDDEVVFQFTADKLLSTIGEVKSSYYTRCCVNLNNSTDMKLTFDLMTHPPFTCDLTVTPPMTLFPSHSGQVCIGYELTLDEVVKCANSKSCDSPVVTNSKQLTIKYSTGVEQLLLLTSRVFLPVIHVDIEHLVFGACLLDQPTSKLVTIYNDSNCTCQWSLSVEYTKEFSSNCVTEKYSDDQFSYSGVFAVVPINGITHPQQSTIITVTFAPIKEMEYAAVVNVNGVLGDHVSFSVSGNGSADEATLS